MRERPNEDNADTAIDRQRIDRRPESAEEPDPIALGWRPDPERFESAPAELYEIDRDYVETRWGTRELPPAWGWGPFERSTRGYSRRHGTLGRGAGYGYDGEAVVVRPGPEDDSEMPLAGEHMECGPRGYCPPDERIHEDVCEQMTEHPYLDCSDIEVTVEGGDVVLEGTVRDAHLKHLAEDVAYGVRGVREVHNEIRVRR